MTAPISFDSIAAPAPRLPAKWRCRTTRALQTLHYFAAPSRCTTASTLTLDGDQAVSHWNGLSPPRVDSDRQ